MADFTLCGGHNCTEYLGGRSFFPWYTCDCCISYFYYVYWTEKRGKISFLDDCKYEFVVRI